MKKTKVDICAEKPTVNKIIEAAIELFATKGLAAVSVKELADAAGVNIALISYYFGGKDNLYAYILRKQLAVIGDEIDIISREECSPIMKIRHFADVLISAYSKNLHINRLFYLETFNPTKYFDSIVKPAVWRLHNFLRECIKDAIARGEFRDDIEPDLAAMSLVKILNVSFTGLLLCNELLPEKEKAVEKYISQAVEIYLTGVTKINRDI